MLCSRLKARKWKLETTGLSARKEVHHAVLVADETNGYAVSLVKGQLTNGIGVQNLTWSIERNSKACLNLNSANSDKMPSAGRT